MRILFLCKRQFTGKDVVDDRYGRLFELPRGLAERGHDVHGLLLSYRRRTAGSFEWAECPGLGIFSVNLLPLGPLSWPRQVAAVGRISKPDVIWASSDVPHLVLGQALSARWRVPWVADLYDNYESFGLSRFPGAVAALRRACRNAAAVTVVGDCLAAYVSRNYGSPAPIHVIGNGIRSDIFHPRDQRAARAALGLPLDARLVGTAGALEVDRGVEDLLRAFARLAEGRDDVHLVLAGPRDAVTAQFSHPRLHYLGQMDHAKVGLLFSALDVGVVCNVDSEFGRYCYPLKLQEMRACGIPVVAASVGEAATALSASPGNLYGPGDVDTLLEILVRQLGDPSARLVVPVPDWRDRAIALEAVLKGVTASAGR